MGELPGRRRKKQGQTGNYTNHLLELRKQNVVKLLMQTIETV